MTNDDKDLPRNSRGEIILNEIFDASVWAKEFMCIKQEKDFLIDESLMLAWFANAIMAGYDYAYREMRNKTTSQHPNDKDLKPCPFCGGEAKYFPEDEYSEIKHVIECQLCGASLMGALNKSRIISSWNHRPTPQQPNGYDMDGNLIQYGLSGGTQQPSETMGGFPIDKSGVKPSEPLKELDVKQLKKDFLWNMPNEPDPILDAENKAKFICDKYGQPSEKKALSVERIEEILLTKHGQYLLTENAKQLAQAIHSALPARKDVKWPEEINVSKVPGINEAYWVGRINEMRDACIKAYEEAMPAQREVRYPEKIGTCTSPIRVCHPNGELKDLIPCTTCNSCKSWVKAIDEFKKLNGG